MKLQDLSLLLARAESVPLVNSKDFLIKSKDAMILIQDLGFSLRHIAAYGSKIQAWLESDSPLVMQMSVGGKLLTLKRATDSLIVCLQVPPAQDIFVKDSGEALRIGASILSVLDFTIMTLSSQAANVDTIGILRTEIINNDIGFFSQQLAYLLAFIDNAIQRRFAILGFPILWSTLQK